jgi:hypothetical protein
MGGRKACPTESISAHFPSVHNAFARRHVGTAFVLLTCFKKFIIVTLLSVM